MLAAGQYIMPGSVPMYLYADRTWSLAPEGAPEHLFSRAGVSASEIDVAMKRAYNRWLGDRSDASGGRLRWACMPPLMNMEETIKEMRWAKDHGAVAVGLMPTHIQAQPGRLPAVLHIQ